VELITDAGLVHLQQLTNLDFLNLNYAKTITDAGLEHLKGLTRLEELWLSDCPSQKTHPRGTKAD